MNNKKIIFLVLLIFVLITISNVNASEINNDTNVAGVVSDDIIQNNVVYENNFLTDTSDLGDNQSLFSENNSSYQDSSIFEEDDKNLNNYSLSFNEEICYDSDYNPNILISDDSKKLNSNVLSSIATSLSLRVIGSVSSGTPVTIMVYVTASDGSTVNEGRISYSTQSYAGTTSNVYVNGGTAGFNVPCPLGASSLTVTVQYYGTSKYANSRKTQSFKVNEDVGPINPSGDISAKISLGNYVDRTKLSLNIRLEGPQGYMKPDRGYVELYEGYRFLGVNSSVGSEHLEFNLIKILQIEGEYNITAVYHYDSTHVFRASGKITILPFNEATIKFNDTILHTGDEERISFKCMDKFNFLYDTGYLVVTLFNETYNVDVKSGVASILVKTPLEKGVYNFTVKYINSKHYINSSYNFSVCLKSNIQFNVNEISGRVSEDIILNINVLDEYFNNINEGCISLNFNNQIYNLNITGNIILVNLTLPKKVGIYNYSLNYNTSKDYFGTYSTFNFVVMDDAILYLKNEYNNLINNDTVIDVTVKNTNGELVSEGNLTFEIDDKIYYANVIGGKSSLKLEEGFAPGSYLGKVTFYNFFYYDVCSNFSLNYFSNVKLNILDKFGRIQSDIILEADICDDLGNIVDTGEVVFKIEDKNYTVNVSNGKAVLNFKFPKYAGRYRCSISYKGSEYYYKKSSYFYLISKDDVSFSMDYFECFAGQLVPFNISVKDSYGRNVYGGNIYWDNVPFYVSEGVALMNCSMPWIIGFYNTTLLYKDALCYYDNSLVFHTKLYPRDTNINIIDVRSSNITNSKTYIDFSVIDNLNRSCYGGFSFYLNGKYVNFDFSGKSSFNFELPSKEGTYNGTFRFIPKTSCYNPCNTSFIFNVRELINISFITNNLSFKLDNPSFNVSVVSSDGQTVNNSSCNLYLNNKTYSSDIIGGVAFFTINSPIKPGIYNATLINSRYVNNVMVYAKNISKFTIEVHKLDLPINLQSYDINKKNISLFFSVNPWNNISGGYLDITLFNKTVKNYLNSSTVQEFSIPLPEYSGNYTGIINYRGSDYYNPFEKTFNIVLPSKKQTYIEINSTIYVKLRSKNAEGNKLYFVVKDSDGNLINGTKTPFGTVNCFEYKLFNNTLGKIYIGESKSLSFSLPYNVGIYDSYLHYISDDFFLNDSHINFKIIVYDDVYLFMYDSFEAFSNTKLNLSVHVSPFYYQEFSMGIIRLTVDDKVYESKVINNWANFIIDTPSRSGLYNITAQYKLDDVYESEVLTRKISIKSDVSLNSINSPTYYNCGGSFTVSLVDKNSNEKLNGVKLKLRVFTGNKYKDYYVYTNNDGVASLKISGLAVGNHKVEITSKNTSYVFTKVISNIKVSKVPTIIKAPKVISKYKKTKYFSVTIKNKVTKKPIKSLKVIIKVFTGKKYKIYNIKTNSKGIVKLNTKYLIKGTHKVVISSGNRNFLVSSKSAITIK